jgi:uncharacterized protein YdaU (DUF1376 family)
MEGAGVNYYEHHLGDWAAATGHLSWDEDMAYTRLLRAYYHHEKPIQKGQQYRMARASTPAQRRAVDAVIAEFFELDKAGECFRQKRADAEIERFQDKQRKAKASADARWSQSARNANASPDAMRTHSEGNALQTPDTRPKEEKVSAVTDPPPLRAQPEPETEGHQPTAAGLACRAMRAAGMADVNPGDPRLLALLEQGASAEELRGVAADAVNRGKGFAWALKALEGRRADAAAISLAAAPPATVASAEPVKTAALIAEMTQRAADARSPESQQARRDALAKLGRAAA